MYDTPYVSQVLVVQKVDSAIQRITQRIVLILIHWIVIYLVDSAIHLLNNRCLISVYHYYMAGSASRQDKANPVF